MADGLARPCGYAARCDNLQRGTVFYAASERCAPIPIFLRKNARTMMSMPASITHGQNDDRSIIRQSSRSRKC